MGDSVRWLTFWTQPRYKKSMKLSQTLSRRVKPWQSPCQRWCHWPVSRTGQDPNRSWLSDTTDTRQKVMNVAHASNRRAAKLFERTRGRKAKSWFGCRKHGTPETDVSSFWRKRARAQTRSVQTLLMPTYFTGRIVYRKQQAQAPVNSHNNRVPSPTRFSNDRPNDKRKKKKQERIQDHHSRLAAWRRSLLVKP